MSIIALFLFWILFFREFFLHPYKFATSDHLSTYFSHWHHIGLRGEVWDHYHFGDAKGIPFTCIWYPLHWITSGVSSFLYLDQKFVIYTTYLFLHYFFGSICWYFIFDDLFCAITLTYAMRFIHMNQSICFTWAWTPFTLLMMKLGHPIWAGVGFYMMCAGGYWPLGVFVLPFTLFYFDPWAYVVGGLLCAPQVYFTWRYMRNSIRSVVDKESKNIGSIPPWHFISYLIPLKLNLNGVLYPELSYGIGRIGFGLALYGLFYPTELRLKALLTLIPVALWLAMGKYVKAPVIGRIPARAMFMTSIALVYSISNIIHLIPPQLYAVLLIIQCLDILVNHSSILLFHPFMEPAGKPSKQFDTPLIKYIYPKRNFSRVSGLPHPLFAGHITGIRGLGYCGGCMPLDTAIFRNLTNKNGDGNAHDYFSNCEDDKCVDDFDIKFAYRPAIELRQDRWMKTPVPHLWERRCLTQQS